MNRTEVAKEMYAAFARADRDLYERLLAEDFTFSAPPDPLLDRDGFFERCWPGAGDGQSFEFVRLIEHGDEVVVTYELDGRGRNTEVLTIGEDRRLHRAEVYFGWELS